MASSTTTPTSTSDSNHQQQQLSALTRDLVLPGEPRTTTPRLVYGTAWKADQTADLVHAALKAGFRGVDTAAQPRHYQERLVGDGIRRAIADGAITRADLYLQTKFTSLGGQDPDNLPYDPAAPLEEQVRASVASSLANLATSGSVGGQQQEAGAGAGAGAEEDSTYIDCLVLHSPLPGVADTLTVWRAMSEYVPHRVRHLGISNAPHAVVRYLLESPEIAVKPSVVQNRFYGDTRYEVGLRALCRDRGVAFQTFWTLTGNPSLVRSAPYVADLAAAAGVEREVAFYALVLGLGGTSILDGTKNAAHMREDLEGLEKVGRWAEQSPGRELWEEALGKFKAAIGEEREHVEEEGDED